LDALWLRAPAHHVLSELCDVCHASLHFFVLAVRLVPIVGPLLYTFGLYLTCLLALPTSRKHGCRYMEYGCIRNRGHCLSGDHQCSRVIRVNRGSNISTRSVLKVLLLVGVVSLLTSLGAFEVLGVVAVLPPREVVVLLGPPASGKEPLVLDSKTNLKECATCQSEISYGKRHRKAS